MSTLREIWRRNVFIEAASTGASARSVIVAAGDFERAADMRDGQRGDSLRASRADALGQQALSTTVRRVPSQFTTETSLKRLVAAAAMLGRQPMIIAIFGERAARDIQAARGRGR